MYFFRYWVGVVAKYFLNAASRCLCSEKPLPLLIPHPALTHGRTQYALARDEVNYVGDFGREHGYLATVNSPVLGEYPRLGPIVSFSRSATTATVGCRLGQHTRTAEEQACIDAFAAFLRSDAQTAGRGRGGHTWHSPPGARRPSVSNRWRGVSIPLGTVTDGHSVIP